MQDSFISLKQEALFQQEMKKSVFIAHAAPIKTEAEAEAFIEAEWDKYPDATHIVYAYKTGKESGHIAQKMTDNGEPQGTSGPPVFDVLDKNDIYDAIITVTRYFGGTLLGTGGLVKAYGSSASSVVRKAGLVSMVPGRELVLDIAYEYLDIFDYQMSLRKDRVNVISKDFSASVKVKVIVDLLYLEEFTTYIMNLTQGSAKIEKGDISYQAKSLEDKDNGE